MQIKLEQVLLLSILVTWYGSHPRTSNQLGPPKTVWKSIGSFTNLAESENSYLPSKWKYINQFFHISLLEPDKTSTIANHHQEPSPPVIIEEEEEWEVTQIQDPKLKRGKLWYLVEWKGFSQDPQRATWESTESLKVCPELIKHFHSLYPEKAGPNSSRAWSFMVLCGERNNQK
ncbi:hypothetical protein O181_026040 [Austropuccinia psidii MF-1]|uniref:Chromo domain-containing protein n=1 Tax=Austropuccinia psidii MF-1 TaxID=1389203 RepID=A0A9Q3H1S9_9BASI|nr:hypothetical protein [Austropuccinia psidii MF-1]